MNKPTFNSLIRHYQTLWDSCVIDADRHGDVHKVCSKIVANQKIYEQIEAATRLPWFLVAALHNMECSLDFNRGLFNGEPWHRPTKLVPAGLGPFKSFQDCAIEALKFKNLVYLGSLSLERMLYLAEDYNGWGYMRYHKRDRSPYVWACTTANDGTGKYVADGKYDPNAPSEGQVGVAAIFKWLNSHNYIALHRELEGVPLTSIDEPQREHGIVDKIRGWFKS